MPRLTQVLTFQPVGEDGSGSAARARSVGQGGAQCRERLPRLVPATRRRRRAASRSIAAESSAGYHACTPPPMPSCCSTASIFCFAAGRGGTIGSR